MKKVIPPDGYRIMEPHEVVLGGDQCLGSSFGSSQWVGVNASIGSTVELSLKERLFLVAFARKCDPEPTEVWLGEWEDAD